MLYKQISSTTSFLDQQRVELEKQIPDLPDQPYILVVDDDEGIISVVKLLLESEGYAGLGISDSSEVIPFLERVDFSFMPSAILLDLMMPGISGYQIAEFLSQHENFSSIPVIIMTADCRVHDTDAIAGAVSLISKPFHIDTLLSTLEQYLLSKGR